MRGQQQYCQMIRELSGALDGTTTTPDYLEATIYSKDEAVIMVGNFCDVPQTEKHKVSSGIYYSLSMQYNDEPPHFSMYNYVLYAEKMSLNSLISHLSALCGDVS